MNTGIVRFICTLVVLAISSVSVVGSPKGPFITLDNENTLIREIAALLFRQARDQGIALRIGFDRDLLDRQVLLEPVVSISFVIEGLDLSIASTPVHRDRLGQGPIRLQACYRLARGDGPRLECRQQSSTEALAGKTDAKVVIDYNGNPVLSAFTPVDLGGFTWALLAEIDEAEVRAPINSPTPSVTKAMNPWAAARTLAGALLST